VLRDETNPRSVAFQVKGLTEYIERLEQTHGRFAGHILAPAHAALRTLQPNDLYPESLAVARALEQLRHVAHAASDALSLKFFSHATPRSLLSLVA